MYFKTKCVSECCGCGACSKVCPQKAINMQKDASGFAYPVIDESLCTHCGLCERTCIFAEKVRASAYQTRYYAVRHKDDVVVQNSSSGGMLTLMCEEIFSRGGVVFGVAYGKNYSVEHRRASNMDEAEAFRTSKYVQSDNQNLYEAVLAELKAGKDVLVTGTPCQISGLKAYMQRVNADVSRLYTCDNICHGVSSPLTFHDYMHSLESYIDKDDRLNYVNMRYKDKKREGATRLEIRSEKEGSLKVIEEYSYYRLFLNRIALRQSCFECRFTSYSRPGDLSVADFWNGKQGDFGFDITNGVNEVLVNTDKGRAFFNAICKRAYFQEVTKEKAWQPHLEYPTQKPEKYEEFWSEYLASNDPEKVMRKYLKVSPLFKIINFATPILRKLGLYTLFGKLYRKVFVRKAQRK